MRKVSGNQTLSDWMSDAEYGWRARLQLVNLVIETDYSVFEGRRGIFRCHTYEPGGALVARVRAQ